MKTSKAGTNGYINDLEITDDNCVDNNEKKNAGRRRQDAILLKNSNQKMNLDRRASNSDRRVNTDPNYNGPSRRYTIDRRLKLKDRRDNG